jgi:hypothetical protein
VTVLPQEGWQKPKWKENKGLVPPGQTFSEGGNRPFCWDSGQ